IFFLSENVSLLFKLYCLTVMTLVAATYTVALRYTRIAETELYFATTAVCITEVIKLFLSVGILAKETGSLGRLMTSLRENILGSPKELLKLSVPSVVYAVQNNMAFLALSNLDAAVYQVTYQLKIPCTALCTVLMLNRSLSKLQWFSVFMLCGGVTLVQWKPAQVTKVQVSLITCIPSLDTSSEIAGCLEPLHLSVSLTVWWLWSICNNVCQVHHNCVSISFLQPRCFTT
ncbi:CMP-sialic acid transporter, partial [Chelonia mydas]